jgi:hypothetical protein
MSSLPIHLFNIRIVTNGDMSNDITSLSTNIDEAVSYCIQAKFTGSPVGSIKLQASNDPVVLGYSDITETITAVTTSGNYMINADLPAYSFVQLVYTRTSGSGTLNATINAKRR